MTTPGDASRGGASRAERFPEQAPSCSWLGMGCTGPGWRGRAAPGPTERPRAHLSQPAAAAAPARWPGRFLSLRRAFLGRGITRGPGSPRSASATRPPRSRPQARRHRTPPGTDGQRAPLGHPGGTGQAALSGPRRRTTARARLGPFRGSPRRAAGPGSRGGPHRGRGCSSPSPWAPAAFPALPGAITAPAAASARLPGAHPPALPPGPAAAPAAAPCPRGGGWRRMAAAGLTVRGAGPKMAAERDRGGTAARLPGTRALPGQGATPPPRCAPVRSAPPRRPRSAVPGAVGAAPGPAAGDRRLRGRDPRGSGAGASPGRCGAVA